ncbi:MAG: DUF4276 family protein [candidate division Zixibacteria bacterium]|nr:DUF4276 family protein [candidate division Zixibacteria bacterium]
MTSRKGVIVDGQGDYASLRARFGARYRILKTDGPRGHTVPPAQIVLAAKKQIAILRAMSCETIVLLTDFECRRCSYEAFLQALATQASSFDCGVTLLTASPNRMIENWYLADISYLSRKKAFLRDRVTQRNFEGCDGKRQLRKFIIKGNSYNEVTHGPQLFVALRFSVARKNSPSFDSFLRHLEM